MGIAPVWFGRPGCWQQQKNEDRLAGLSNFREGAVLMKFLILNRSVAALFAVAVAAGCAEGPRDDAGGYQPHLEMHDFMDWVMDPLADVIWRSAGTITTMEGVEDLAPTTQEGWDGVRNAAATIAEIGNVLQIPGYSKGEDWNEYAEGLSRTGLLLIEAAEQKDDQKVFDYGGQLYNVCVACHQRYVLPEYENDQ